MLLSGRTAISIFGSSCQTTQTFQKVVCLTKLPFTIFPSGLELPTPDIMLRDFGGAFASWHVDNPEHKYWGEAPPSVDPPTRSLNLWTQFVGEDAASNNQKVGCAECVS